MQCQCHCQSRSKSLCLEAFTITPYAITQSNNCFKAIETNTLYYKNSRKRVLIIHYNIIIKFANMFDTNLSVEEEYTASSTAYDTQSRKYQKPSLSKQAKIKKRFLQQKRNHSNTPINEENEDPYFTKIDNYSTRGLIDACNEHEVSFDEITNDKGNLNSNSELNYYTLKKGLSSPSYEYVQYTHG